MTTEEKAKAYDEALKRAKAALDIAADKDLVGGVVRTIFPEFLESEDERIRKELIEQVGYLIPDKEEYDDEGRVLPTYYKRIERYRAYLEKQKDKGRSITANLLEDDITGIQRELIEFLANNIDASWVDVIKSADAYAQRIRSMFEKQKESLPIPDKFSGLKSLMLQYLQSAANRKDDSEIESDTDLWGRKILDYVWKYDREQKEQPTNEEMIRTLRTEYEKGVADTIAKYEQKEQKPLSTEETELNSIAFLEQMGYTCIPPKKEHQNNSDAPKNALGGGLNSPLDKDKNLDDIAQDYIDGVKEYNPEPTWNLMQTAVCYGYHCREEEEQKPVEPNWIHHKVDLSDCSEEYIKAYYDGWNNCNQQHAQHDAEQKPVKIQWTGKNLKEVIDFTGKSPKFGEWFKSWEDFENYVHSHDDILKLFCEDGSHYEVPVGAWIIKTPDGYNIPSRFRFIQKPAEWSEAEKQKLNRIYEILGYAADDKSFLKSKRIIGDSEAIELQNFLESFRPSWKPSEEQTKALNEVINTLAASKHPHESGYLFNMLNELRKNLKKL